MENPFGGLIDYTNSINDFICTPCCYNVTDNKFPTTPYIIV